MTVADVLVSVGIIGLLAGLALPAIESARERSRQLTCQDRLRQFGIAAGAHESIHTTFPVTSGHIGIPGSRPLRVTNSVSPHRGLMSFLDPAISGKIDTADTTTDFLHTDGPTMHLSDANRALQDLVIPHFLCPSDRTIVGGTSYRANIGVSTQTYRSKSRSRPDPLAGMGGFENGKALRPDEFTDGLSNTALFSERVVGDGNPGIYDSWRDFYPTHLDALTGDEQLEVCRTIGPNPDEPHDSWGGHNWLPGGVRNTWYDHIATPNSIVPDCGKELLPGGLGSMMAARSMHPGGVNVCFADGHVRLVAESIDLGVWRALGTRMGGEVIDDLGQ